MKSDYKAGLWKKLFKDKKTGEDKVYLSGSFQNYWVAYFRSEKLNKTPQDPDGFLKLTNKGNKDEVITVNMYNRISQKNVSYISGKRHMRFNIFVNNYKSQQNTNAPDYTLIVSELEERRQVDEMRQKNEMVSVEETVPEKITPSDLLEAVQQVFPGVTEKDIEALEELDEEDEDDILF